ncbi:MULTISPECIES: UDP-N-acetylmuramoyl-L-alanine--D-glutamate ligase [Fictibacillus]|uniref:UDP-N-acetylmuramoylalanine--D-glutamate ligase n=1 Tax=Fictibacillus enclensis TaxID=1017270 RepID=A0A0V8JDC1_9BACL|nr:MULTISPECIES: UDP-N-acetylmuramoyl-L-alanine--D-glutamate ligase [Fictibacillus]KSU84985.1 UDP-N-acetylmuramoylalanine--D-glutamate ligase [Fictibacillus enclensis]RXY99357.1 UDP-N-acetylmuramoyl-L-alanine--D-glutamate ligase [Fictibacillus sp. S7]SCB88949.1 UDP-N-acetylmuramoylalanine--D-glutamate ligase [Fictibacillus enclensis]
MNEMNAFQGKHVLVLGLAKSGFAAAKLLKSYGAQVVVNDRTPFEENEQAKVLSNEGYEVICGEHPLSLLDRPTDFVVKNPGIPYSNPIVSEAVKREIPVITEVEIAGLVSRAEMIGITGSNGKTTTTTLIGEMLKNSGREPVVAGNIGTVLSEVADRSKASEIIVAELSSFQLMGTQAFAPKIAVLLNLFEAHLDYHGSFEDYAAAKGKIFGNQQESDFAVYNQDDEAVLNLVLQSKGTKVPFSVKSECPEGAYIKAGSLYFKGEEIISLKEIVLPGQHNLENILAAVAASKLAGAKNEQIRKTLKTFTGVKHRLQYVDTIQGRKFYNDSKATNILATQKAISAFGQKIILLAGGLDRGNEFDDLVPQLKQVKTIVLFGQTAPKLERAAKAAGIEDIKLVDNVEEAVPAAYQSSTEGDVILLSPACASWDQFKTFEQRGDIFINSVHKLK